VFFVGKVRNDVPSADLHLSCGCMSTALSNEATLALSRGPAPSVPGNIFSPQMPSAAGCRAFVAKKCCEEGGPFSSAKMALFLSAVNRLIAKYDLEGKHGDAEAPAE